MSTDLVSIRSQLPAPILDSKSIKKIVPGVSYIPRLQLMTSRSDAVMDQKISARHWALIPEKDRYIDLGEECLVVPIDARPLALDMSNKENIIRAYDEESELYQTIKTKSAIQNSGCMSGPQFLVYVVGHGYATWHATTASSETSACMLMALLEKSSVAVLGWRPASNAKFKWEAPTVAEAAGTSVEMDLDEARAAIDRFRKEAETADEVEVASDTTGPRR